MTAPGDEDRFAARQRVNDERLRETLADFGRLLDGRFRRRAPDELDMVPLVRAARRVLDQLHVKVPDGFQPLPGETPVDVLTRLAAASGVRLRRVHLDGDWIPDGQWPLVAFLDDEERPVALVSGRGGRCDVDEPESRQCLPLTPSLRGRLGRVAYAFHPILPSRKLGYREIMTFGLRQVWRDLAEILLWGLIGSAVAMLTPIALAQVINIAIPNRDLVVLGEIVAGLLLALVAQATLHVGGQMAMLRVEGRMALFLHAAMVDRLLRLPAGALRRSTTVILATQMETVEKFRRAFLKFQIMAALALIQGLMAAALVTFYAPAAGLAVSGLVVVLVLASAAVGWQQFKAIYEGERMDVVVLAFVYELIRLIPALRSLRAENRAFVQWGQNFLAFQSRLMRSVRISNLLAVIESGWEVVTLAVAFAAIAFAGSSGGMSVGAAVAFVAALGTLMAAGRELSHATLGAAKLLPMAKLARPLIEHELEDGGPRVPLPRLRGSVELAHVGFGYDGAQVLSEVSLSVAPGEFVGIVGPSGSGKSTLLRLILGLDAPQTGLVTIDGQDLQQVDRRELSRQVGTVLQHGQLFPGSIFENIRGATALTLDEAWEVADLAGIGDELRCLPMGLHTLIGEAGAGLSGGQVQRLLIARALAARPAILVLDEATSALDGPTQARIFDTLANLAPTRIVVAHRLSTLARADRIYVLDRGRIVDSGSFRELAGRDGPFRELIGERAERPRPARPHEVAEP